MRPPPLAALLDVLFVLLLFLMACSDFDPREQELLTLPEARQMRDYCSKHRQGPPVTINIHHRDDRHCLPFARRHPCGLDDHWWITIDGRECTDPIYLRTVLVQESQRGRLEGYFPRNRRIIVRADAASPTGLAQRAMNACAGLGFQHLSVAAARPVSR